MRSDPLSTEQRSRQMGKIRGRDTKPERRVRQLLHGLGYRFRVQLKGVPGRPDIAFPGRRKVILVHGCFWHAHAGCARAHVPRTRPDYWIAKFERNRARDERQLSEAEALGWSVLILWECEVEDEASLRRRLEEFVGPTRA